VKTLLAGPSPISFMKAETSPLFPTYSLKWDPPTISRQAIRALATVWPVDTSRPLATLPDDLKIRKIRGGMGVQSTTKTEITSSIGWDCHSGILGPTAIRFPIGLRTPYPSNASLTENLFPTSNPQQYFLSRWRRQSGDENTSNHENG